MGERPTCPTCPTFFRRLIRKYPLAAPTWVFGAPAVSKIFLSEFSQKSCPGWPGWTNPRHSAICCRPTSVAECPKVGPEVGQSRAPRPHPGPRKKILRHFSAIPEAVSGVQRATSVSADRLVRMLCSHDNVGRRRSRRGQVAGHGSTTKRVCDCPQMVAGARPTICKK